MIRKLIIASVAVAALSVAACKEEKTVDTEIVPAPTAEVAPTPAPVDVTVTTPAPAAPEAPAAPAPEKK